jgi:hypothetical protein
MLGVVTVRPTDPRRRHGSPVHSPRRRRLRQLERGITDAFDETRRGMGVTGDAVYQAVGNPNDVTVTHDFESEDAAKAILSSAELKGAMENAGVVGERRSGSHRRPRAGRESSSPSEPAPRRTPHEVRRSVPPGFIALSASSPPRCLLALEERHSEALAVSRLTASASWRLEPGRCVSDSTGRGPC